MARTRSDARLPSSPLRGTPLGVVTSAGRLVTSSGGQLATSTPLRSGGAPGLQMALRESARARRRLAAELAREARASSEQGGGDLPGRWPALRAPSASPPHGSGDAPVRRPADLTTSMASALGTPAAAEAGAESDSSDAMQSCSGDVDVGSDGGSEGGPTDCGVSGVSTISSGSLPEWPPPRRVGVKVRTLEGAQDMEGVRGGRRQRRVRREGRDQESEPRNKRAGRRGHGRTVERPDQETSHRARPDHETVPRARSDQRSSHKAKWNLETPEQRIPGQKKRHQQVNLNDKYEYRDDWERENPSLQSEQPPGYLETLDDDFPRYLHTPGQENASYPRTPGARAGYPRTPGTRAQLPAEVGYPGTPVEGSSRLSPQLAGSVRYLLERTPAGGAATAEDADTPAAERHQLLQVVSGALSHQLDGEASQLRQLHRRQLRQLRDELCQLRREGEAETEALRSQVAVAEETLRRATAEHARQLSARDAQLAALREELRLARQQHERERRRTESDLGLVASRERAALQRRHGHQLQTLSRAAAARLADLERHHRRDAQRLMVTVKSQELELGRRRERLEEERARREELERRLQRLSSRTADDIGSDLISSADTSAAAIPTAEVNSAAVLTTAAEISSAASVTCSTASTASVATSTASIATSTVSVTNSTASVATSTATVTTSITSVATSTASVAASTASVSSASAVASSPPAAGHEPGIPDEPDSGACLEPGVSAGPASGAGPQTPLRTAHSLAARLSAQLADPDGTGVEQEASGEAEVARLERRALTSIGTEEKMALQSLGADEKMALLQAQVALLSLQISGKTHLVERVSRKLGGQSAGVEMDSSADGGGPTGESTDPAAG